MMVGRTQSTLRKKWYRGKPVRAFTRAEFVRQDVSVERADDRWTPQGFVNALDIPFTLDAAASKRNRKCERFFTHRQNGLEQSWADEIVWCNPPYSDIPSWIAKAHTEMRARCRKVVMLLPANRTEQGWWHDFIEPFRDRGLGLSVRFVRGRVRFERAGGIIRPTAGKYGGTKNRNNGSSQPPFGNVLIFFERPWRCRLAMEAA